MSIVSLFLLLSLTLTYRSPSWQPPSHWLHASGGYNTSDLRLPLHTQPPGKPLSLMKTLPKVLKGEPALQAYSWRFTLTALEYSKCFFKCQHLQGLLVCCS